MITDWQAVLLKADDAVVRWGSVQPERDLLALKGPFCRDFDLMEPHASC